MNSIRRIAHLDMDAFFASVELLRYPELRGRAVVVGGRADQQPSRQSDGSWRFSRLRDYAGRGVATTSTYEARLLGVFSGMGLMKSARLAPEAILLPANFDAYRDCSRRFKAAVAAIAPRIEDRGIDEIYIDLSDHSEEANTLARRIKRAVREATGLTCSIAIAPNKLLAKIGSDLDKPDGITLLGWEDIPARIWPLPAKKVNGIGPKSAEKLARLGINTIGELAATPLDVLLKNFGPTNGAWLHAAANGLDERELVTESEPKSISRETTFERDLHAKLDRAELSAIFTGLCLRLAEDLNRKGYACKTVGIKLRYADFHAVTRDLTLSAGVSGGERIRKVAGECLKRVSLTQRIRLLGVRASGLTPLVKAHSNELGGQSELPF
ncbi:DNA polymerase IV [Propionivibrio sp.]|uniref:DNA polymerase IV n=1 Tax=Propionivibrio sp. TaxID=2212460 RepID=UPI0025DF5C66|nr:DNA polymerase IV [Propionivibrio sp.]MBK7355864.1 DNA polymerase IV [Propionivibrio sp.]MBL0206832.1 DNA polymerase IV [Propionivibrio sp.]